MSARSVEEGPRAPAVGAPVQQLPVRAVVQVEAVVRKGRHQRLEPARTPHPAVVVQGQNRSRPDRCAVDQRSVARSRWRAVDQGGEQAEGAVILVSGGCCGPALTGGLTSQLPDLVRAGTVPRAFSADSLTYNAAGVAGPAVAGVPAGMAGAGRATFALAAIAAAGAAVLALVPFAMCSAAGEDRPALPLTAGVRAIAGDPVLRTVTLASSLGQLGPGALAVVAAVLATAPGRPAATGWLLSAVAAGGLLGSLAWTWRPAAPARAARTVMIALVGVGVPLVLTAATTASLP